MNPHTPQPPAAALARRLPLAVLIAAAPPAFAQQPAADMATVIVAASRSQTKVEQMPLHTTIVSSDEIKSSPAQTLDQLLRNVPGLNFSAVPAALSDPTGHQTKMRGLGNAKVLVLLDGVPIHDPFYLTTQWFKVPLSNIDHIEILRGGNSSLWGNMAVAGVVNIVTKRARSDGGQVQVSAGTQGSWNVAFSRNVALSERAGFNLSGDVFHTDGYLATPDAYLYRFPRKRPTEAENRNLSLTAWARPSATVQGYVRVGYHQQDQQIGYVYGRNLQKSPDLAAQVEKKFADRSLLQANAWAQYVAFDKLNGNTCYYQGGTTCLTSASAALTPAKVNENVVQFYSQQGTLRYRERGASLLYSTRVNPLLYSVLAGVDYRRLSAEDTELFYNTPVSPSAPQGRFDSSTAGQGTQTFEGVFGQFKLLPLDALDLTLSARLDRYAIGDRANRRTLASGAVTGGALPAASKTAFNPSLAGRYELSEALSVRAAAYKAFRAPGFNNLTRSFGTGTSTTIANPDLVPENLRGWEAGLDYRREGWTAGLTYFLYNISDMIATFTAKAGNAPAQVQLICGGAALPNCGGSAKYYTNDQDGQAHGVELTAGWRVSSTLRVDAYATHTDSYLTRRGAVVTDPLGVQLTGLPKNTAWLGVSWQPAPRWRTHVEARYVGPMLLDTTSVRDVRYGQGGSTALDASVQYNWSAAVTLFARGSNLLDRRYSENAYSTRQPYNQTLSPPRSVQLGLRANF